MVPEISADIARISDDGSGTTVKQGFVLNVHAVVVTLWYPGLPGLAQALGSVAVVDPL